MNKIIILFRYACFLVIKLMVIHMCVSLPKIKKNIGTNYVRIINSFFSTLTLLCEQQLLNFNCPFMNTFTTLECFTTITDVRYSQIFFIGLNSPLQWNLFDDVFIIYLFYFMESSSLSKVKQSSAQTLSGWVIGHASVLRKAL